jgi:CRP/FNR family cyclic AMP-dependent transcriptional regulator
VPRANVAAVGIPWHASSAGTPRRLSHGDVVVRQGDPSSCLFLVASGAVRLSSVTRDGREVVVGLIGPGDVFGESALLGRPSPVDARVIGTTRVVALPLPHLRDVLRRYPITAEELLRLVASRLHRTSTALEEALASDLPTRVSLRLRDLASKHGIPSSDGIRLRVPLTQEELARMVGASREAVNRTMGGLTARGLVRTEGRTVVIPDPEALESAVTP